MLGPALQCFRLARQLQALAECSVGREPEVPVCLRGISSPLNFEAWRAALLPHPDKEFVEIILQSIEMGFRVGFNGKLVRK